MPAKRAAIRPEDLRARRARVRLLQRHLQDITGIPAQRISDFENGIRTPTPEQLHRIVEALSFAEERARHGDIGAFTKEGSVTPKQDSGGR